MWRKKWWNCCAIKIFKQFLENTRCTINCEVPLTLTWHKKCALTSQATRDTDPDANLPVAAVNIGPQDVPKMSHSKSPGSPLKMLFDHPRHVSTWRPGDILKWRPGDFLIWSSRDIPRRLIWDVSRTFKALKLGFLEISFNFFFRTYSINQTYLKTF